ncbi:hypothetical protein [Streptomyces chilikensis]|uniref:Uncharacterized protein n=1 Tax=Streptomyces chilikensis TaxID=1194079 RepID=A0ABV3EJH0_9ACTN
MSLRNELRPLVAGLRWTAPFIGSLVLARHLARLTSRIRQAARRTGKNKPTAPFIPAQKTPETGVPQPVQKVPTPPPAAPAKKGAGDRLENAGITALILLVAYAATAPFWGLLMRAIAPYLPLLVGLLIGLWLIAACVVAPRNDQETAGETEESGEQHDEHQDHDEPEDTWPARRDAIRLFVEHAVAAGAAGHRPAQGRGAPLEDLMAELADAGAPRLSRKEFETILTRAGIPYREQMKFRIDGKRRNLPGVHIDDLTKALSRTPHLPPELIPDLTPGAPTYATPTRETPEEEQPADD